MKDLVAVGMSGGVDSSVAAALLLDGGHDVVGVTMRLGLAEASGRACCGERDAYDARHVCDTLGIRHVVLDMSEEFSSAVLRPYTDALAAGTTPNPCVWCNERVKFGALVESVRRLGIEQLATGHYVRVVASPSGPLLARGADRDKDQSYFLYRVAPTVLDRVLFPLGELEKPTVRRLAAERGLSVAHRPDSQDLCFADERDAIVRAACPDLFEPGPIIARDGRTLGTHSGLAHYTVGQRRGLGIGGAETLGVVALDVAANAVVVAPTTERTGATILRLVDIVWNLSETRSDVLAQTRYRTTPVPARAIRTDDGLSLDFQDKVTVVAPGQSVVLYNDDTVVGGGIAAIAP
jgi:tRNA-specific 2-thiouridylase